MEYHRHLRQHLSFNQYVHLMTSYFTVVIPTFTGLESIDNCLDSILGQEKGEYKFDVVVVIDGPNQALYHKVLLYQQKFQAHAIQFKVVLHPVNLGHFEARYRGAREAGSEYILFIDDRVTASPKYFSTIIAEECDAVIPNVLEGESYNLISETLGLSRRWLYRKYTKASQSVRLTSENFDTVPKGTTSLTRTATVDRATTGITRR